MTAVANSSPLIWLAKAGRLDLLKAVFGELLIPEKVYEEVVVRGLEEGFKDPLAVKRAVEDGWIKVVRVRPEVEAEDLHPGEVEAISLAKEKGCTLLADDRVARALAKALGVEVRGTAFVLLRAVKMGLISGKESRPVLHGLVGAGFRLDPALLSRLFGELERAE